MKLDINFYVTNGITLITSLIIFGVFNYYQKTNFKRSINTIVFTFVCLTCLRLLIEYFIPLGIYKYFIFLIPLAIFIVYYFYKKNYYEKHLYKKEIPKTMTVGMVSYLLNLRISKLKDLSPMIMNLLVKKAIVKKNDIYVKGQTVDLKKDEQYIYDWFFSDKESYNISKLKKILETELVDIKLIKLVSKQRKFITFILGFIILIGLPLLLEFYQIISHKILFIQFILFLLFCLYNSQNKFVLTKNGKIVKKYLFILKSFLTDFTKLKTRNENELNLYNEYFAFASILGVNEQNKNSKYKISTFNEKNVENILNIFNDKKKS